jgi:phosphoglycolate phosphatase
MFDIKTLLNYERVVLQCHDNPDPDAIASAFALYRFLEAGGVDALIVYSGFSEIRKANLLLMTESLGIPARYIGKDDDGAGAGQKDGTLLVTVDCQYGAGNVKKLAAKETAVIDHHIIEAELPPLCDVRPYLGSCSTLVWKLLRDVGFPFRDNPDVCTALYYGLYTDTGNLAEIVHPLDMDLRDSIKYDTGLMKKLKNSNLSLDDLVIAGKTLNTHWIFEDTHSAIFEAEPCDPNILGFTSDLALQVYTIDACVVFCNVSGGIKLSVRSCVRETMANELASRLCEGVGSGGGHKDKAGGFISGDKLNETGLSPSAFLKERFIQYYSEYDLVYSDRLDLDLTSMEMYRKKEIPVGYAQTTDVFPPGAEVIVRTIEGDTYITADPDIYIMVGVCQEIWPIRREKFEASYLVMEGQYKPDGQFWTEDHYEPTVKDKVQGEPISLLPYIKPCIPNGGSPIYAKKLEKRTKVFTSWNYEGYMYGGAGDFLAVRADDSHDVYAIEKSIFHKTYEKIEK